MRGGNIAIQCTNQVASFMSAVKYKCVRAGVRACVHVFLCAVRCERSWEVERRLRGVVVTFLC